LLPAALFAGFFFGKEQILKYMLYTVSSGYTKFSELLHNLLGTDLGLFLQSPYHEWSLLWGSLKNPVVLLIFFIPSLYLLVFRKNIRWELLEWTTPLKYLIFLSSLILTWTFSTHDINHFVGQEHYFDRLILIALNIAILLRPGFIWPYLCALLLMASQSYYWLGEFSVTDKMLPLYLVMLFSMLVLAIPVVRRFSDGDAAPRISSESLVVVTLAVMAGHYVIPALYKISIGPNLYEWVFSHDLHLHTATSYGRGWLNVLSKDAYTNLIRFVDRFEPLMLAITLAIELAFFTIMWNRRWALVVLSAGAILHLGIFAFSGIFFWKWIFLEVILVVFVMRLPKSIFNRRNSIIVALVIVLMLAAGHRPILAWFNIPISNNFVVKVIGASGQEYLIDDNFMSPFGIAFSFNRLYYLLPGERAEVLRSTRDWEKYLELKSMEPEMANSFVTNGDHNYFNEQRAQKFDVFFQTYFANLNQSGRKKMLLSYLGAPPHLWHFLDGEIYRMQEPVVRVKVFFKQTYYAREQFYEITNELVRDIKIAEP
jgi:hypothetical protein